MSDTRQAQREGWIEKKVQRVMRNYDLKDRQTLYDLTDVLRDAMAFADAHREGQEVAVLREALDRAAYALFQAKRLAPEAVREHCAKAHEAACKVLDEIPTPPPREQGDEHE